MTNTDAMTTTDTPLVYLVDDDPGMLESTRWLLDSVGLQTEAYNDGRSFLAAVQPQHKGCVILDVRMPGLGGLNVQEELHSRGILLPVIFVSGHADVPIVVRAFKAGAFDFIEKPFNEQLLLDSVQTALETERQRVEGNHDQQAALQRINSMTPRERDVFLPLAQGYTSREIAEQLAVSVKTVDLYRARVMKRLDAERLPDIVGLAIVAGMLDPLALRK